MLLSIFFSPLDYSLLCDTNVYEIEAVPFLKKLDEKSSKVIHKGSVINIIIEAYFDFNPNLPHST